MGLGVGVEVGRDAKGRFARAEIGRVFREEVFDVENGDSEGESCASG